MELGLTAPAVTLQLRQAEEEVNARLFDRTRSGLVPTEVGLAIIGGAEDVLERLRMLEDEARAMVSGRTGRVRLGAVSTAKYFAPSMIAAFARSNPGVEVEFLVGNRTETIDRIRHNELDLVIMGRPPRNRPLEAAVIGDHPFVIVAPPDHRLAGQKTIRKEQLVDETFLLRERGSGTRSWLDLYFADIPDKRENLGVDMGSNESIKQAVMAGLGIALLSAHTVAAEVGEGWLCVLDVEGLPIMRQWYCVTPARRTLGKASIALRDFITGEGAAYLPRLGMPEAAMPGIQLG